MGKSAETETSARIQIKQEPEVLDRDFFAQSSPRLRLSAGNKDFEIGFHYMGTSDSFAAGGIGNIEGRTPTPGTTTALYNRLFEILQQTANLTGNPIFYSFSSHNSKMQKWAESGRVKWKHMWWEQDGSRLKAYSKRFFPQK